MENPSDVSPSLHPQNVSSEATYIISPTPDLPIIESKLWIDTTSNTKSRRTSASCSLASDCPNPEDTELLTPTRLTVNKCHVCKKEFKTLGALKTHLFIHRQDRPHKCGVCLRAFKHHHQFTSHMMTHQKWETHHCTQPGCRKTYRDKNSLKQHCAFRHRVDLTSASSTSPVSSSDLLVSLWKPAVNRSPPAYRSLLMSQPKAVSAPIPRAPSYSGKHFGSYDKGKFGCYTEDAHSPESWTSVNKFHKVEESTGMPTPTQMTLSDDAVAENLVVLQNPIESHALETSVEFPECNSEEWKKIMMSFQSNKVAATSSVGWSTRPPASVCPILPKYSLKETKPLNKLKRRHSFSSFNSSALLRPKPKSGFDFNNPDSALPSSPASFPNSRKRKSCSKDILTNVSSPPLPVPQSRRHKESRSSCVVSPSQVPIASFRTFLDNPFFQKETVLKSTGEEPNSGCRRTASVCRAFSCEGTEERDSQSSSSTLDKGHKGSSKQKQKSKGTSLSPLVMPVSVPVFVTNVLGPQTPAYQAKRLQTCKGASKRSRCLDTLKRLIIPTPPPPCPTTPHCTHDRETQGLKTSCATSVFFSQLRSPTYLADQLPPPYTPQPMLSPLRPGTGLYFKNLPQDQPCTSLLSTTSVSFPVDNTTVNIQPRINIGVQFQAEIPPVRDSFYLQYEEHPAQLVWSPWKDLSTNIETQQRVTELIDLCCSSVLPAGGTNIELALHCLHEVGGNIKAALDLLLMKGDFRSSWHPLSDYHYIGSDHWTAQEMKTFKKALDDYDKDFQQIHSVVQTKSIAQCVEYYYNMKKLKKFKQSGRVTKKRDGGGDNFRVLKSFQDDQSRTQDQNTPLLSGVPEMRRATDPPQSGWTQTPDGTGLARMEVRAKAFSELSIQRLKKSSALDYSK